MAVFTVIPEAGVTIWIYLHSDFDTNVMDDVGGYGGYLDFLETIHGADRDAAKEMRDWARQMGWTGRMSKPENML